MASVPEPLVQRILPRLFQGACGEAVDLLQRHIAEHGPAADSLALVRLAAQRTGQNALYYLKLFNVWNGQGQPALKPNVVQRKLRLLTDYTSDNLAPLLKLFAATYGVQLDVQVSAFDSVEQLALDPHSSLELDSQTIVVVSLSEHWLERYLGKVALVADESIARTQAMLDNIVAGLKSRRPQQILITNFAPRAYARPAGLVRVANHCGWNHAVARLNLALVERDAADVHVIDLAEALFAAGGRQATGRVSYFRSKMAFESLGTIAVAREIASTVGQLLGKSHRALVTDWDNTLWGGEVAEAGSHGVICGLDSPDALAYCQVQEFMKSLTSTGTLLAAVSRNDPQVAKILTENVDLALRADDFATLQIGFQPKSQSIAQAAQDLGFGSEFMVFVDDSLFELAEAVTMHPYLDVLLAGPEPEATLRALSESRFFNAVSLQQADLERGVAAQALKQQRDFQASFTNIEEFLQEIRIRIDVAPLNDTNVARVVQMFQKSNQFNLTTRRHGEHDLRQIVDHGGTVGVFSYEDAFGSQGMISVVNLVPRGDSIEIESWVMSCRVLNRTVEQAVCHWIVEQAAGREIVGHYLPTEKNNLVRGLYRSLGFELVAHDATSGHETWRLTTSSPAAKLPKHYAELRSAA